MAGVLTGRRVLVVEDEYYIAADLRRTLSREGAEVVGPVGNLDAGLALAEGPIDAAVLDVNLEEAMSFPIADRLQGRDVPYMFLTGYDGWALPPRYEEAVRLAKPFAAHTVVSLVSQLISPEGPAA